MLIEFTVGNYRSFQELQTLSMVAAPIKSKDPSLDENTVIEAPDNPGLLSSAAVYGPNASGKSNLIRALSFMQFFVLNSPKETKAIGGIQVEPFRLSTATIDQPSHFEAVFIESGKRYRYGFEATGERVTEEWLYFVPSSREARLFEREGNEIIVGSYFREGRGLEQQTRPNALFLSVAAQFNGPTATTLVEWFRRLSIVYGVNDLSMQQSSLDQLLDSQKSQGIKELIRRLDLGIQDLHVERAIVEKSQPVGGGGGIYEIGRPVWRMLRESAEEEQLVVKTVHTQYDEEGIPAGQELFDLSNDESEGTQKLFALSSALLDTLQDGEILVIDELDARLHPLMTREIISLFNSKTTNPNGAQLVFTTQDTNLLDNTLFRRDQIWFIEKDQQGESHLYSLAEFRVRNDKDFERGYIQGRYGAIPYLSRIHTILEKEHAEKA